MVSAKAPPTNANTKTLRHSEIGAATAETSLHSVATRMAERTATIAVEASRRMRTARPGVAPKAERMKRGRAWMVSMVPEAIQRRYIGPGGGEERLPSCRRPVICDPRMLRAKQTRAVMVRDSHRDALRLYESK